MSEQKAKAILGVVNHYLLHGDYPHLDKSEFNVIAQALQRFVAPEARDTDGERYRWLNRQHNFLLYVEGPKEKPIRENLRLRCGIPLNDWIDRRIEEERQLPQHEGKS